MRASGPAEGPPPAPSGPQAGPPTGPPAEGVGKAAWREWARAVRRAWAGDPHRRAQDEGAIHALLAGWGPVREARCVLAYVAFGDEPDPVAPWLRTGDAHAPTLATTRTLGPREPLELRAWVAPFERHPFGFLQPRADAPTVEPGRIDLVLVPGLAFDVRGGRLGHGQGHYDRLLPTLPGRVPRVGVALDALVVERLPMEAHDVRMTHLLTPSGVRAVAERGLSDAAGR